MPLSFPDVLAVDTAVRVFRRQQAAAADGLATGTAQVDSGTEANYRDDSGLPCLSWYASGGMAVGAQIDTD